ncbi:MAG: hypothetical protein HN582_09675 [Marinovum sp.]|mgnify:CR=1 FL=1|nr:hypothetical protein [Marinovum sp.]MBT7907742.1 hypothetical protein [Marinovum sp.]MDG2231659.1 hypothetical protein [Paracoccaceae bacterium]
MSYKDKYQGVTSVQIGGSSLWFVPWLFTIEFAKLGFWSGVLAIAIWPYHLGVHFAALYGG